MMVVSTFKVFTVTQHYFQQGLIFAGFPDLNLRPLRPVPDVDPFSFEFGDWELTGIGEDAGFGCHA